MDASKGMAVTGGHEYVLLLLVASIAQILLGVGALALTKDDKSARPSEAQRP